MFIIGDRAQKMDEEGEGFLSILKRYVTKGGNLSSFPGVRKFRDWVDACGVFVPLEVFITYLESIWGRDLSLHQRAVCACATRFVAARAHGLFVIM